MGAGLTIIIVVGIIMSATTVIAALDTRRKKNDNASAHLHRRIEELEKHIVQQDETIAGLVEDNEFVRRMIDDKTEN